MSTENILVDLVPPDTEKGDSPNSGNESFKTLREKIFGGGAKTSKNVKKKPPATDTDELSEKELADLFAGENWEEVSSLYFDARFALTGYDGFLLTNPQKKTLGLTLGKSMKMLLKIDPGYIALTVFLTTFGGLITQKELTYRHLLKKEMAKRGSAETK